MYKILIEHLHNNCFTAAQSVPTFVQEIKDVRTTEQETVVFECLFSGTPTPGKYFNNN